MKKVISLLIAVVTLTLLLCSCGRTGKVVEAYNDASTIEQVEPVDTVQQGLEKYLSESTHDKGQYAIFAVEGVLSRKNGDRVWLVCYIDNDGDSNWYFVEWRGDDHYEKYAFQP